MSSLSFPDVDVWLALAAPEHVYAAARQWWAKETGRFTFSGMPQMGLAAAIDGGASTTSFSMMTV